MAMCCMGVLVCASSAWASSESASRYFKNGVALLTANPPNYQDAYYQFKLAHRDSGGSWKVLGNLGLCAMHLERDADALEYYRRYLSEGGDDVAEEERRAIEQDLLLLEGNLSTVELESSIRDLRVIDQRVGSTAPAQPYALKDGKLRLETRAGSHTIRATSAGKELVWNVVLQPGQQAAYEFDFRVHEESTEAAKPEDVQASRMPATRSHAPAYVAFGLGGVALGAGGYLMFQSLSADGDAERLHACDRTPSGCNDAQRGRIGSLETKRDRHATQALIAAGVGGAAVLVGTVLLLLSGDDLSGDEAPNASANLAPWVGTGSAGLQGRF
jgi:hypothetical protein